MNSPGRICKVKRKEQNEIPGEQHHLTHEQGRLRSSQRGRINLCHVYQKEVSRTAYERWQVLKGSLEK